jgi:hypothetical protein
MIDAAAAALGCHIELHSRLAVDSSAREALWIALRAWFGLDTDPLGVTGALERGCRGSAAQHVTPFNRPAASTVQVDDKNVRDTRCIIEECVERVATVTFCASLARLKINNAAATGSGGNQGAACSGEQKIARPLLRQDIAMTCTSVQVQVFANSNAWYIQACCVVPVIDACAIATTAAFALPVSCWCNNVEIDLVGSLSPRAGHYHTAHIKRSTAPVRLPCKEQTP